MLWSFWQTPCLILFTVLSPEPNTVPGMWRHSIFVEWIDGLMSSNNEFLISGIFDRMKEFYNEWKKNLKEMHDKNHPKEGSELKLVSRCYRAFGMTQRIKWCRNSKAMPQICDFYFWWGISVLHDRNSNQNGENIGIPCCQSEK